MKKAMIIIAITLIIIGSVVFGVRAYYDNKVDPNATIEETIYLDDNSYIVKLSDGRSLKVTSLFADSTVND